MDRLQDRCPPAINVGAIHGRENMGEVDVGRSSKRRAAEETKGSWQNESPHKEELELLREVRDLRFDDSSMRQALKAGKIG